MTCTLADDCSFYLVSMQDRPCTAAIYREKFCDFAFEQCARHLIARTVGREHVPADLYPNHTDRAQKIITVIAAG